MEQRINAFNKGQKAMTALYSLGIYLKDSQVEQSLLNLIYYRVSQINGCAFCLDMHSKDLLAKGETEQRLLVLNAWREAPFYTDRERTALGWAEVVTNITDGHVRDEDYEKAKKHFTEEELVDLTVATVTINCYNRINIAFRTTAGAYKVGLFAN
ncbi:MAG TPA: carboxymuconolactone decarboxylase family protein [Mucilaginibacter sp.]|jgi:AhpD family alkylhydroperoxidase|nr:carboxymuconolactone decarboxylase family protein [Mucilaginibacter sp.]